MLFRVVFDDYILYMIVDFIFKSWRWAFIGIWAFIRINMVFTANSRTMVKFKAIHGLSAKAM